MIPPKMVSHAILGFPHVSSQILVLGGSDGTHRWATVPAAGGA